MESEVVSEKTEIKKRILIKPGAEKGKDASFHILTPTDNRNDVDFINVIVWTIFGEKTIGRSVIGFKDLIHIDSSYVDSVFLNLHLISKSHSDSKFSGNKGESIIHVLRVTSDWEEYKVNWINQPSYTYENFAEIHEIGDKSFGKIKVDVTKMFTDNDNKDEISFYLKFKKEELFSQVLFASSDYSDPTKHPELEIFYREIE